MRYSVSISLPSAGSVQVDRVMDIALTSGSLQSATVVSVTVIRKEQDAMGNQRRKSCGVKGKTILDLQTLPNQPPSRGEPCSPLPESGGHLGDLLLTLLGVSAFCLVFNPNN